jgi:hypothetical protein
MHDYCNVMRGTGRRVALDRDMRCAGSVAAVHGLAAATHDIAEVLHDMCGSEARGRGSWGAGFGGGGRDAERRGRAEVGQAIAPCGGRGG